MLLVVSLQMLLILAYSDRVIAPSAATDHHVAQHTHCNLAWTLEMSTATDITQSSGFTAGTSE